MPCTTLLVGKNASYDGSTIVARNEDAPSGEFTAKRYNIVKPSDQPRHYRCVISHLEIDLPEEPMRYSSVPNANLKEGIWGEAGVNEANVSMSETETLTTNERVLGADPLVRLQPACGALPEVPGGIGEEDMLTLVLPYIRSAREGVLRLGGLLERYGTYEMNGIAFQDVDEIWWLETVGGHHWIAKRVPDDAYVVVPNQLSIDSFDLDDAFGEQAEHLCSADLREWMAENYLDLTMRFEAEGDDVTPLGTFNPREAFGSASDSDHVYNTPRTWAIQRFLNPTTCVWDGPEAAMGPESDALPWDCVPERKVTVEDVKYALSLHYQGTPYDPYGHAGCPDQRGKYRAIGINRNCQLSVVQLRPGKPEAITAVQWIAFGSNPFNALVPFYPAVDEVPAYMSVTPDKPSTESFYWANRLIAAIADPHFAVCAPHIERYQLKVGGMGHAMLNATDKKVAQEGLDYKAAEPVLRQANEDMARKLQKETTDVLDKVLFASSMLMKNAFSRSDG